MNNNPPKSKRVSLEIDLLTQPSMKKGDDGLVYSTMNVFRDRIFVNIGNDSLALTPREAKHLLINLRLALRDRDEALGVCDDDA